MHCDDVVDVVFQAVNDEVKQLKDREKSVADGRDAQSPATVCCRRFFLRHITIYRISSAKRIQINGMAIYYNVTWWDVNDERKMNL